MLSLLYRYINSDILYLNTTFMRVSHMFMSIYILIKFSCFFNGFADFVSSCIKSQILMSTEDIKEDTEEPSGNQGAIMKPEEEVEYQKEDAPRMEIPQCDKIKIALQTRERFMSSKRYQRSGFNHLFWSERRMYKIYKHI